MCNARSASRDATGRRVQFAQDRHHATGAVNVFHVIVWIDGRDLGQMRHAARHAVDVLHREIDPGFVRGGQQVQHGVGRTAHGDVERIAFSKASKLAMRVAARVVILFVIAPRDFHDQAASVEEQVLAVGMGGQHRAVAGQ